MCKWCCPRRELLTRRVRRTGRSQPASQQLFSCGLSVWSSQGSDWSRPRVWRAGSTHQPGLPVWPGRRSGSSQVRLRPGTGRARPRRETVRREARESRPASSPPGEFLQQGLAGRTEGAPAQQRQRQLRPGRRRRRRSQHWTWRTWGSRTLRSPEQLPAFLQPAAAAGGATARTPA